MTYKMDKSNPLENWNVPDFEKEYATKYSHENQTLVKAKSLLESSLNRLEEYLNIEITGMKDEIRIPFLAQRWNGFQKELNNFLASPRKFGDIFTEKMKTPYVVDKGKGALSFSNTPKQCLTLNQGKTHVAIGFVDLDLLLRARFVQNKNSVEQPNKFIGYESSVYAVAKTNVIKEMMMEKAPIRSIIEVWTSTVWTRETLKHFENAVKIVLQYENAPNNKPPNPTKKELHPKVRSLISHWNESVGNPKSRQEAHELWVKTFNSENGIFSVVANLIESRDRVQAARHILTGEFPLMDDQQKNNLIASITMFNCNDEINPHSTSECMFQMMPMDAILPKNKQNSVSIEIYLHHQTVTSNDNSELLTSIRKLDPWTMSWSNICDYSYAPVFHKLLQACSGNDTVHVMTSMSWVTEVFGAHILEHESKYRREIYDNAQKIISTTGKSIDPSGYFRYDKIIMNPCQIGSIGAASGVKESWKNYFFKGQDLNVGEVSFVPYAQTHKTHTLLNICYRYTFNKDINVHTEITS
ncbi:hypothetical protein RhiirA4_411631 [Rhizophagus irregularis]|uniref:Uncharacterized protein n=1 Tax=Rhizophagus irregularis TaxID=588596 RepID=A0A2I1HEL7_9GLOM|nr:hypothetical protein RhiirA4_411631 [Rhizophagus irregularis]